MAVSMSVLENYSQDPDIFQNCMRTKLLSMSELKSSIPKPTPYVRIKSETRSRSNPSSPFKQNLNQTSSRIPAPCNWTCKKVSHLQNSSSTNQNPSVELKQLHKHSQSSSPSRPKSANQAKSCINKQYMHVKSKIDNAPPYPLQGKNSTRLKSHVTMKTSSQSSKINIETKQFKESPQVDHIFVDKLTSDSLRPKTLHHLKSKISVEKSVESIETCNEDELVKLPQGDQNLEEIKLEEDVSKTKFLNIHDEVRKGESSQYSQPPGVPFDCLMWKERFGHIEGIYNQISLLTTCGPEFLSSFEKEMQGISQSWLELLRDVIMARVTGGKSFLSRFSISHPSHDQHREIFMFLKHLATEGEPLHEKLYKIEEEQMKVLMVVIRNIMALTKEYENLKEKNYKLEKTQSEINSRLEEELAILSQENKELDKKYTIASEKYNLEKSKREEIDKHQIDIFKDVQETHKIIKLSEKKYSEVETKVKKAEACYKAIEIKLRKSHLLFEKEGKKYEEMLNKYGKSETMVKKLQASLEENKITIASIEETKNSLQTKFSAMKSFLDESLQKRSELVEEVSQKSKKLKELEAEINIMNSKKAVKSQDKATQVYSDNLENSLKDILRRKNHQIQELKKKTACMGIILKDWLCREEKLSKQIEELEKNFSNNNKANKACWEYQVQKMHRVIKILLHEIAELERILGGKTVKTDRQNVLMQTCIKNLQPSNETFSVVQDKMCEEKEFANKLMALIFEHYNASNKDNKYSNNDDQQHSESVKIFGKNKQNSGVVDERLVFRKMKMAEMFCELEKKQMTLTKLERRVHRLQIMQEKKSEEIRV